jgi:peptidoglycan/xylan/chitin deacetylase (PgdA/CDA1 family)
MNAWTSAIPAVAGAGLLAWGAFHPRSQLFGPTVWKAGNACALTFDDGPNPSATPRLLVLLHKYGVRATFFVLGKYVRANPGLLADIAAGGHVIGNHTDTHPNLVFSSRRDIMDELQRCEDAIVGATGARTIAVRPPFGFRGPQFHWAARRLGFSKIVMWSISARDWKPQASTRVSRRIQKMAPGDIVLFHDGDHRASNADRSYMLQALEFWLPRWNDSGLQFVSLE